MGRAPCCDKTKVKRGPWSPEEDTILKNYIQQNGTGGNWIALPRKAGLNRCGKSCRLRWLNYLRPDIRHGNFTADEDYIICSLYNNIGSRWSVIALNLPGRTDNDVKNYWNTKLKKKLLLSSNSNPSNGRDIFATTTAAATTNNTAIPSTSFLSNLAPIQLTSQVVDHKDPNLDQFPTPLHMNHSYYYDQGSAQENVNLDQMSRQGEYISTNNCSGSWCTASVSQVSSNAGSRSGPASSSSMGTILSDEISDYNGISATTTWDDYDNGQKRVVLNEVSEGVDAYWMELFLSSSLPDQFYSHDDVVSAGYDLQGKMSEVASIPDGSSDNLFVSRLV